MFIADMDGNLSANNAIQLSHNGQILSQRVSASFSNNQEMQCNYPGLYQTPNQTISTTYTQPQDCDNFLMQYQNDSQPRYSEDAQYQTQKGRKHMIPIVDPNTGKDVLFTRLQPEQLVDELGSSVDATSSTQRSPQTYPAYSDGDWNESLFDGQNDSPPRTPNQRKHRIKIVDPITGKDVSASISHFVVHGVQPDDFSGDKSLYAAGSTEVQALSQGSGKSVAEKVEKVLTRTSADLMDEMPNKTKAAVVLGGATELVNRRGISLVKTEYFAALATEANKSEPEIEDSVPKIYKAELKMDEAMPASYRDTETRPTYSHVFGNPIVNYGQNVSQPEKVNQRKHSIKIIHPMTGMQISHTSGHCAHLAGLAEAITSDTCRTEIELAQPPVNKIADEFSARVAATLLSNKQTSATDNPNCQHYSPQLQPTHLKPPPQDNCLASLNSVNDLHMFSTLSLKWTPMINPVYSHIEHVDKIVPSNNATNIQDIDDSVCDPGVNIPHSNAVVTHALNSQEIKQSDNLPIMHNTEKRNHKVHINVKSKNAKQKTEADVLDSALHIRSPLEMLKSPREMIKQAYVNPQMKLSPRTGESVTLNPQRVSEIKGDILENKSSCANTIRKGDVVLDSFSDVRIRSDVLYSNAIETYLDVELEQETNTPVSMNKVSVADQNDWKAGRQHSNEKDARMLNEYTDKSSPRPLPNNPGLRSTQNSPPQTITAYSQRYMNAPMFHNQTDLHTQQPRQQNRSIKIIHPITGKEVSAEIHLAQEDELSEIRSSNTTCSLETELAQQHVDDKAVEIDAKLTEKPNPNNINKTTNIQLQLTKHSSLPSRLPHLMQPPQIKHIPPMAHYEDCAMNGAFGGQDGDIPITQLSPLVNPFCPRIHPGPLDVITNSSVLPNSKDRMNTIDSKRSPEVNVENLFRPITTSAEYNDVELETNKAESEVDGSDSMTLKTETDYSKHKDDDMLDGNRNTAAKSRTSSPLYISGLVCAYKEPYLFIPKPIQTTSTSTYYDLIDSQPKKRKQRQHSIKIIDPNSGKAVDTTKILQTASRCIQSDECTGAKTSSVTFSAETESAQSPVNKIAAEFAAKIAAKLLPADTIRITESTPSREHRLPLNTNSQQQPPYMLSHIMHPDEQQAGCLHMRKEERDVNIALPVSPEYIPVLPNMKPGQDDMLGPTSLPLHQPNTVHIVSFQCETKATMKRSPQPSSVISPTYPNDDATQQRSLPNMQNTDKQNHNEHVNAKSRNGEQSIETVTLGNASNIYSSLMSVKHGFNPPHVQPLSLGTGESVTVSAELVSERRSDLIVDKHDSFKTDVVLGSTPDVHIRSRVLSSTVVETDSTEELRTETNKPGSMITHLVPTKSKEGKTCLIKEEMMTNTAGTSRSSILPDNHGFHSKHQEPFHIPSQTTPAYSQENRNATTYYSQINSQQILTPRQKRSIQIVDPKTGKDVSDDIRDAATDANSSDINRNITGSTETHLEQSPRNEIALEFAAKVAETLLQKTHKPTSNSSFQHQLHVGTPPLMNVLLPKKATDVHNEDAVNNNGNNVNVSAYTESNLQSCSPVNPTMHQEHVAIKVPSDVLPNNANHMDNICAIEQFPKPVAVNSQACSQHNPVQNTATQRQKELVSVKPCQNQQQVATPKQTNVIDFNKHQLSGTKFDAQTVPVSNKSAENYDNLRKIGENIYYDIDTELGRGATSVVFKGTFRGGHDASEGFAIAVKRVKCKNQSDAAKSEQELKGTYRELEMLDKLEQDRHKNIVGYYGSQVVSDQLFIAFELCQGTLCDYVKDGRLAYLRNWFKPVLVNKSMTRGLSYVHKHGIAHRDLKPANIFFVINSVNKVKVVVGDFGCAKAVIESVASLTGASGTLGYIAPEAYRAICNSSEEEIKSIPAKKSDIYSLGLLFYFTNTSGSHPFGTNQMESQKNISEGKAPDLTGLEKKDYTLEDLLTNMLKTDPNDRPNAEHVENHPALWEYKRILDYFIERSNVFEALLKSKGCRDRILENTYLIPNGNWMKNLPKELKSYLENYEFNNKKLYKGTGNSARGLLRAIRNIDSHFRDFPENVKAVLGSYPNGHVEFWLELCPKLLLHVHKVLGGFSK